MGKVELNGTQAFQMFGDIYRIAQEFWNFEDDDDYWERLYEAICWFLDRNKSEPYAERLVMSFLEWKEDECHKLLMQKIMKGEKV